MRVRRFGQGRRLAGLPLTALALLAAGAPALAQDAETPAPTPAPSSIFRLPPANEGRAPGVQGPADNGLPPLAPGERGGLPTTPAPAPPPQPSAPRVVPTQPDPAATARPAAPVQRDTREAATPRTLPATDSPSPSAPSLPAASAAPAPVTSLPVTLPAPAGVDAGGGGEPAAPAQDEGGRPLWAWLLAALAAVGAGVWYWRRRPAFAGDAPAPQAEAPPAAPRAATPPPAPTPIAPPHAPLPAPRPASPLVTRAEPEQRALVTMALDIRGIRIRPDRIEVAFTLGLTNQGPIEATGLMVRIALNQGSAMPQPVLARFFDGAGGSVLRDDIVLAPGATEQLGTEVVLPRAGVEPLMIAGKPMLVPVMAFDVTYHWDGPGEAFGQNAGSFVLGRASATSDKLAPLPLDRPMLDIDRPGARATAVRRNQ